MEALTPLCHQCLGKCCLLLQEVTATSLPSPGEEKPWNIFWVCNLFFGLLWTKYSNFVAFSDFVKNPQKHWSRLLKKICGISILGDTENLSGHRQPPLAESALRRGVELGDFHSSLPTSVLLWFYNITWTWKKEKYYHLTPLYNVLLYSSRTNITVWVDEKASLLFVF